MNETMTMPNARAVSIVDYLRAKLAVEITAGELKTALEKTPAQFAVVDVRDAESFAKEHIRGAVSMPAQELASRLSGLPKDKTLVVYCFDAHCALAPKAALELAQKGFLVRYLLGGIAAWTQKGLPVEKRS